MNIKKTDIKTGKEIQETKDLNNSKHILTTLSLLDGGAICVSVIKLLSPHVSKTIFAAICNTKEFLIAAPLNILGLNIANWFLIVFIGVTIFGQTYSLLAKGSDK